MSNCHSLGLVWVENAGGRHENQKAHRSSLSVSITMVKERQDEGRQENCFERPSLACHPKESLVYHIVAWQIQHFASFKFLFLQVIVYDIYSAVVSCGCLCSKVSQTMILMQCKSLKLSQP